MIRAHRHLPHLFLASAVALTAFGTAPALAEPAAPAPVPIPYPNTSSPNTSSQNAAAPRDAANGLPTGKRMHKPYTLTTSAPQSDPCTAPNVQPVTVASSDPQEGGEVARTAAKPNVAPVTVASADPEEGGEVARTAAKPKVSDIKVVKVTDKASPRLAESAPSGTGAPCNPGQH